jgi:hypothetical protein
MPPKFQRHFTRAITTKAALLIKQIDYRAFTLEGFAFVSGHKILHKKTPRRALGFT